MSEVAIGFSGHQGLTDQTEKSVNDQIRSILGGMDSPIVGYCSLAEGADQLFAQSVLSLGGSLVVVVPCKNYESTFDDSFLRSYKLLSEQARKLIELDFDEPSEEAFWSAGKRVVDETEKLIAVWNGKPAAGLGGTGDVVKYARDNDREVTVIWPPGAERK